MPDTTYIEFVSIDTQVFVTSAYCFTSKVFEALKAHFETRRLKLVMTDITVREVHARIQQSVAEEVLAQRQFVNQAKALHNSSLPEVQSTLVKLNEETVAQNISARFDAFLQETRAAIINTDNLTAGEVFEKYFAGKPPFGATANKRLEFPDAFAIEALAQWSMDREQPMFVVSEDKLFRVACKKRPVLIPKNTLAEVLDYIASDEEQLANFARIQTLNHIDSIMALAKREFEDRYYWVEDEDGDAQVDITIGTILGEPEIIQIDREEALLQLSFDASYIASLSYDDSATASYDPEDGTLIYVKHREESVKRQQNLVVQVNVSYEYNDADSFELVNVSLNDPSDGFGIETEANHDWPYK